VLGIGRHFILGRLKLPPAMACVRVDELHLTLAEIKVGG
jgi:hypothetical protein